MAEFTFEVPGMTCDGCEKRITDAVAELPGVYRVDADADAGRVRIDGIFEGKYRARDAIEDAGYEITD